MNIIESIKKAREEGVIDDDILKEIEKQNPEKEPIFREARERGISSSEILEEIIKQNTTPLKEEPVVKPEEPVEEENEPFKEEEESVREEEFPPFNQREEEEVDNTPKRKNFIIKIAVVVALLLAVGGFAFFFIGEEEPDPQEEIMQAFHNMMELNSLTSQIYTNIDIRGDRPEDNFTGQASFTNRVDRENEIVETIIEVQAMMSGIGGSFKGRTLIINDKLFAKLERFPDLGMFLPVPVDMSEIIGKNILISDKLSEELSENNIQELKFLENSENQESIKEFLIDVLEKAWEYEVLTVKESIKDEIGGVSVRRHELEFNFLNLVDLVEEIEKDYELNIEEVESDEVVYHCIDAESSGTGYKGEVINREGTTCLEVFPEGEYEGEVSGNPYDIDIRFQFNAIRAEAQMWNINNEGSYEGFDDSDEWIEASQRAPECSKEVMGEDEYQINVLEEEYVAWAGLCMGTEMLAEQLIEEQRAMLKEVGEKLDMSIFVWTDGNYIYRIETIIDDIEDDLDGVTAFELILGVNFRDFNEPLNIEEPEDYIDFEELINSFMDVEDMIIEEPLLDEVDES